MGLGAAGVASPVQQECRYEVVPPVTPTHIGGCVDCTEQIFDYILKRVVLLKHWATSKDQRFARNRTVGLQQGFKIQRSAHRRAATACRVFSENKCVNPG